MTSMKSYFAVDIGGTSAKTALVSDHGTLSQRGGFITGSSITADQLLTQLSPFMDEAVLAGAEGIGIGSLGWFDPSGVCTGGVENMPALTGLCLPDLLKARYGLPVVIHNDVDAMALGEYHFGTAQNSAGFVCIALGTGIGGAIMLDGKLWRGANHRAGEFGYFGWRKDGSCLDQRTSALIMIREASGELSIPSMDGKLFFDYVRQGNETCKRILYKHMKPIGQCVAQLVIALDVELVHCVN